MSSHIQVSKLRKATKKEVQSQLEHNHDYEHPVLGRVECNIQSDNCRYLDFQYYEEGVFEGEQGCIIEVDKIPKSIKFLYVSYGQ